MDDLAGNTPTLHTVFRYAHDNKGGFATLSLPDGTIFSNGQESLTARGQNLPECFKRLTAQINEIAPTEESILARSTNGLDDYTRAQVWIPS